MIAGKALTPHLFYLRQNAGATRILSATRHCSCGADLIDAPDYIVLHSNWRAGGRDGISFFYYCVPCGRRAAEKEGADIFMLSPDDIRAARERLGMTQGELARALHLCEEPDDCATRGRVMVARWETGKHAPSPYLFHALRYLELTYCTQCHVKFCKTHMAGTRSI